VVWCVDVNAFRAIFCIANGRDPEISIQTVMVVLDTANKYGVDFLAGECLTLLAQNITAENVLDIFNSALQQGLLTPVC